jgi:hypothetical protein
MKQKKLAAKKRGGARPGSGPKPKPPEQLKIAYSTRLDPEVVACIRKQENQVAFIEQCLCQEVERISGAIKPQKQAIAILRGVALQYSQEEKHE